MKKSSTTAINRSQTVLFLLMIIFLGACGVPEDRDIRDDENTAAPKSGGLPSPSGMDEPSEEDMAAMEGARASEANPAFFRGPSFIDNPRDSRRMVAFSYDNPIEFGSTLWGDVIMNGLALASRDAEEGSLLGIYTEDQSSRVLYSITKDDFDGFMAGTLSQDDFIDLLEMTPAPVE